MERPTQPKKQNQVSSWISHMVTDEEAGNTLQDIITGPMGGSRRMIQKLTRTKGILLNGKVSFLKKAVKSGDVVKIRIHDHSTQSTKSLESKGLKPQYIPLKILFEDQDLLIIDKPPGLAVHPTKAGESNTLSNGVAYYLTENGIPPVVRPVHRLDLNTSGLIAFAKNQFTHHSLDLQLKNGKMKREYLAVVDGTMEEYFPHNQELIINEPIGRQKGHPTKRKVRPDGEKAITRVKLVEYLKNATLVRIQLETGRTHQIRVHLSHFGHPVAGDRLYGSTSSGIRRQALHAIKLSLDHPRSKSPLVLETDLPEDITHLVDVLRD